MENFKDKNYIINKPSKSLSQESIDKGYELMENSVNKFYEERKSKSISIEEALGSGSREKMEAIMTLISNKFKERGISDITFKPVIFMPELSSTTGIGGVSYIGHIEMHNLSDFQGLENNTQLRQLFTLRLLGHELYHSTALSTFLINQGVNEKKEKFTRISKTASGASYNDLENQNELKALEEGSATLFEVELFNDIKKMFPSDIANNKFFDSYSMMHTNYDEKETLEIHRRETVTGYDDAYVLVKYLDSRIPNFKPMLEKLRIERKYSDLLKAIENEFGEGSYRKITTCTNKEAKSLLQELKK